MTSSTRPNKSICERAHAKKRALERYNVTLNRRDLKRLVEQIQSGAATFVEKQTLRVKVYIVTHGDVRMVAVYDSHRHEIITFLPTTAIVWVSGDTVVASTSDLAPPPEKTDTQDFTVDNGGTL